jgi:CRP-like cAMP-binding protein
VGSIADELVTIPFFRRAAAAEVRASAPLWEQLSLEAGEVLWEAGTGVSDLAVVIVGELVAELDGTVVGRVLPGELLGEATAFFAGATRTATLRAKTPAQVLALPVPSLRTLRWQRSTVYDALLEQALLTLVRRIGATNTRVAQVARGGATAPARTEPSALVRLWKSLRPGGPSGPCPPLEPLLRLQPGMRDADPEIVAALARVFVAEPVTEGQIVFLEGEPGAAAWLVADGRIDVLRHVRGERAELLASLAPGSLFGINTLLERGPRTASCVASTPGWLYRMDAEGFGTLRGGIRLAWRESLLGSLATQIRGANAALQRATTGKVTDRKPRAAAGPSADVAFQDLLHASGFLEGLPAGNLENLEVVITEDQRRNPRPPPGRRS